MQMLIDDRISARQADQFGAAIRADELLGKELGMFVERRLSKQTDDILEGTPLERRASAAKLVAEAFAEIMRRDDKPKLKVIEGSVAGSGNPLPNEVNDIKYIERE